MKKFRIIIYIFIFFVCMVHVDANTIYKKVPKFANDYIKKYDNYQRYIVTENTRYGFKDGIIDNGSNDFKTGGLLNLDEYSISKSVGNSTYLFNGLKFFTMSTRNGKIITIDPDKENNLNELTINDSSGIRVTNYIKNSVKLNGTGSSVNPWTIISKYNVQFRYNDERLTITPNSVVADEEGRTKPVMVSSSAGYRYLSNDCGAIYSDGKLTVENVTSDIICNVEDGAVGYELVVHANGGSLSSSSGWTLSSDFKTASKEISYGEKISTLPVATKTGYTFAGWFTDITGGSQIDENTIMRNALDIYAHWQADEYTLTYDNNGGSGCTNKKGYYDSPWGTLCTPSKDGYAFVEWNTKTDGTGNKITENSIVDGNRTVYAIWGARKYTVTLDAKGGLLTASDGWTLLNVLYSYQSKVCGQIADGTYGIISANLVENAYECPTEFTSCDANHIGTYRSGNCVREELNNDEVKAIKKLTYGVEYGTLLTPTKDGYTFDGWYLNSTKITNISILNTNADHTLEAHWTVKKYSVKFQSNSECPLNTTTYDQISNISYGNLIKSTAIVNPTCSGYDFGGWIASGDIDTSTARHGTTNNPTSLWNGLNKSTYFKNLSTTSNGVVILTASWGAGEFTITADANGGTISNASGWTKSGDSKTATKQINFGSTYGTLPTVTRDGYFFKEWNTAQSSGGNAITSSSSMSTASAHTIYARWLTQVPIPTNSLCKCTGMTTCGSGYSSFAYTGSAQTLTTATSGTGYTLSGYSQTNVNTSGYTITATLSSSDYRWSDNTTGNKTFTCYLPKATPTITLSSTSGTTVIGTNLTYNEKASVKGKFTVTSSATGKATVSQASSNEIAANTNNTVTVKGVAAGSATITVAFTPTDTTNYNNAANKTYSVTVTDASCSCDTIYGWEFVTAVNCNNGVYSTSLWTACSDYGNCASAAAAACQNRQGNANSPNCTRKIKYNCGSWQNM